MTSPTARLQLRRCKVGPTERLALFQGNKLIEGQTSTTIECDPSGATTVTVRFWLDDRIASSVDNRLAEPPIDLGVE